MFITLLITLPVRFFSISAVVALFGDGPTCFILSSAIIFKKSQNEVRGLSLAVRETRRVSGKEVTKGRNEDFTAKQ